MALEQIILTIQIATLPSRRKMYLELQQEISRQINEGGFRGMVEVISGHSENINIGTKRNDMLSVATGLYVTSIDDDDHIAADYLSLILEACKSGADCICINGSVTTNGGPHVAWKMSKDYGWPWFTRDGIHYRTPNHISPVKRELALQAGFPEIGFAEDAEYARRLLPLLKTETIIEKNLYYYEYHSDKSKHEKYRTR